MNIVLCAERDALRERWASILAGKGYTLHQVAFIDGLRQLIKQEEADLVLMHQPFMTFRAIADLCSGPETCKLFVLADQPATGDGLLMLKLGVVGYTNTYASPARLAEAVRTVLSGRVWFGQEIINELIHSLNAKSEEKDYTKIDQALGTLSQREKEIALLVSEGLSNMSIAQKLYISERTVKAHLGTIYQKTGTQGRLQLALLILGKIS